MIRVLLADDEELVRTGLRMILDAEPDITVVGDAVDGADAVARAEELAPDVVLMDIRMPRLDGLEATRRIGAMKAGPKIVILTTFDLDEHVYAALAAGASGFLLKDAPASQLVHAIKVASEGDALLAPSVTRRLIARFADNQPPPRPQLPVDLTARETEVLSLMAEGLSNAEIAGRLVVGDATVKTHVARVLAKLGVRDRVQAVVLAHRSGMVS
ncbi:MAG TPA: response regulator transcription factor [Actinomycetes bacterium]|nr:response regulator transcription factor [Actinomycetes bacterium]